MTTKLVAMSLFNTLPSYIYDSLEEYLQTTDLCNLSQTCCFLRPVFGEKSWRKCIVGGIGIEELTSFIERKRYTGHNIPSTRCARLITYDMFCEPERYSWFLTSKVETLEVNMNIFCQIIKANGMFNWEIYIQTMFKNIITVKFFNGGFKLTLPSWFTIPRNGLIEFKKNKKIIFELHQVTHRMDEFYQLLIPRTEYVTILNFDGISDTSLRFTAKLPNLKIVSFDELSSHQAPSILDGFRRGNFPKLKKFKCSFYYEMSNGFNGDVENWVSKSFISFCQLYTNFSQCYYGPKKQNKFSVDSIEFEISFIDNTIRKFERVPIETLCQKIIELPAVSVKFLIWNTNTFLCARFHQIFKFPKLKRLEFSGTETFYYLNLAENKTSSLTFLKISFLPRPNSTSPYLYGDIFRSFTHQMFSSLKTFVFNINLPIKKLKTVIDCFSKVHDSKKKLSIFHFLGDELERIYPNEQPTKEMMDHILSTSDGANWIDLYTQHFQEDRNVIYDYFSNFGVYDDQGMNSYFDKDSTSSSPKDLVLVGVNLFNFVVGSIGEKMPNIEYLKVKGPYEAFHFPQLKYLAVSSAESKCCKKLRQINSLFGMHDYSRYFEKSFLKSSHIPEEWCFIDPSEYIGLPRAMGKHLKIIWDVERKRNGYTSELIEIEQKSYVSCPEFFLPDDTTDDIEERDFDFEGWV